MNADAPLDNRREVETPEGILLHLSVAGPLPRALAWALDLLLRGILYLVLGLLFGLLGRGGMGLFLVALFLIEWFYPVLFEVRFGGRTPGKRALGLRVVHDDGTPMRWGTSVIRNLLLVVDFLPFLYAAGLASMLLSREFRRLGDLAAGTLVVHDRPAGAIPAIAPADKPRRPPVALDEEERQVLLDFAARLERLTPERARELALAAGPLVADAGDPVARLRDHAAWIAGEGR